MRRWLLIGNCIALLALTDSASRGLLQELWAREDVQAHIASAQAFVEPYSEEAVRATAGLIEQVRTEPVVLVDGKQVGVDTSDNFSLDHGCSMTAGDVEAVLKAYNSPAVGKDLGAASVEFCSTYGIDNAYWLAMFIHESGAGANPAWAGNKGGGQYTANTGNIIGSYEGRQFGRFRDYNGDWKTGARQHFELIACYQTGGKEDFCRGLYSGKTHTTIREVIATWAPSEDNNDPNNYANAVERDVGNWRSVRRTVATSEPSDLRKKVIEYALSREGDPYVSGGRREGGSDCSGFVQLVYKTVAGIDPGATTYSQFPGLKPVELERLQPGDLWYGRWEGIGPPNNEHTGIVADVDGDGKWDLIHNGADAPKVHVTYDFLSTYLGDHTIGFRTVLGD